MANLFGMRGSYLKAVLTLLAGQEVASVLSLPSREEMAPKIQLSAKAKAETKRAANSIRT